jgi:hypothetical protein
MFRLSRLSEIVVLVGLAQHACSFSASISRCWSAPGDYTKNVALVSDIATRSFRTLPQTTRQGLAAASSPAVSDVSAVESSKVVPRMPINESFPGLRRVHSNPDVFVIEDFLSSESCSDIVQRAQSSSNAMGQSPVAYAGWTRDVSDLIELVAKGPVAWLSLVTAWFQLKDEASANQVDLVIHALQNYAAYFVIAAAAIAAYTKFRTDSLQELRTSTSTTIDTVKEGSGTREFVQNTAKLFDDATIQKEAALFEAPTVIRYEKDQVLAPHYDANQSASTEDANRGGQTLATLLVYLNDVSEGGLTRFGKLLAPPGSPDEKGKSLTVQPKRGDALLFFPADAAGAFDDRLEHEGCAAVDEKWIARIWRHENRVPPPFGLSDEAIATL